jgi:hypothetical protein
MGGNPVPTPKAASERGARLTAAPGTLDERPGLLGQGVAVVEGMVAGEQALGVEPGEHVGDVLDVGAHLVGHPQALAVGEFPQAG